MPAAGPLHSRRNAPAASGAPPSSPSEDAPPSPPSPDAPAAPAPTEEALLGRLRDAVPPPVRPSRAATLLPEPHRHQMFGSGRWGARRRDDGAAGSSRRRKRSRLLLLVITALATMSGIAYWPTLIAGYLDAYPGEATKREALRACSAESPTFVRFLADERVACYERMAARLAGSQSAAVESGPR